MSQQRFPEERNSQRSRSPQSSSRSSRSAQASRSAHSDEYRAQRSRSAEGMPRSRSAEDIRRRQELQKRRAAAERAKAQKKKRTIRIAIIIAAILIVAIVIIAIVSCSKKPKTGGSGSASQAETTTVNHSEIPKEYVPATVWHDDIRVTDEYPTVGQDNSYSIHVNTALNAVTVYDASGNAVRVMPCSTGRRDGHETPEGTFTLGEWIIDWCYMADGTEGLYAYRIIDNINNDIMFHSVPYFSANRGDLEYEEYNKLGDYASMGCIRLCCADARWIGETCGFGTEVVIVYDPNEVLAMEPAPPIRIPAEITQARGWDPTDPVSENPWHTYQITLEVPNSIEVDSKAVPSEDPIQSAVTATDNYGNNLISLMSVTGDYNYAVPGTYKVRVSIDAGPAHAYKDVYIITK